jgi:hypothetical protein
MDGGPEGVWISAGKAKRGNSIVTTKSPSFPRRNFAGRRGACVSLGCRASLPAAPRLTSSPLRHGSGVGTSRHFAAVPKFRRYGR